MNRMLKSAVVLTLLLGGSVSAFAYPYPMDAQSLQTVKTFINDSGSTNTSGTVYVLQTGGSNLTTGTTHGMQSSLGLNATTTTTANSANVVGVQLDDSCTDQSACRLVVYGPALTRFAGSTSNQATNGGLVGTSTVSGQAGTGTRLGVLLSQSVNSLNSADGGSRWVFVNPYAQ